MNRGLKKLLTGCIVTIVLFILLFVNTWPANESRSENKDDFMLIIAVITTANNVKRRDEIRRTYIEYYTEVYCPYCEDQRANPQVRVYFFVGVLPKDLNFSNETIRQEQEKYDDLIYLDYVKENMNSGKTFEVMKWLAKSTSSTFVMKADDDSFIVVPNLLTRLKQLKKDVPFRDRNVYYGFPLTDDNSNKVKEVFMAGMGYVISRNLVEFISTLSKARKIGSEDFIVSQWVHQYMRGPYSPRKRMTIVGDTVHFHDHPSYAGPVSWEFSCKDIVIHQAKSFHLWHQTFDYFSQCCQDQAPDTDLPSICDSAPKSQTRCYDGKQEGIACHEIVHRYFDMYDGYVYFDDSVVD